MHFLGINLSFLALLGTDFRFPLLILNGGVFLNENGGSTVKILAYAKINLALAVAGRREDGFHELETVMQSIELHDIVQVRQKGRGMVCQCGELSGPGNLAYKAAEVFLEYWGKPENIEINIAKHIPLQAGLAGGSSDAAATLLALNELFARPFNLLILKEMAEKCGADVPFCLLGGTKWAAGKGEKLEELPAAPRLELVLVKPEAGVNTGEAYRRFDAAGKSTRLERSRWETVLQGGSVLELAGLLSNDLEQVSLELVPEISGIKQLLLQKGCLGALMSGSGSAVFGIARDEVHASEVAGIMLKKGYTNVWRTRTFNKAKESEFRSQEPE